jgi:hypothetical protein
MTSHPDVANGLVTFTIATEAQPGNIIPPLARLLIDLARRRNETGGPAMAARFSDSIPPTRQVKR